MNFTKKKTKNCCCVITSHNQNRMTVSDVENKLIKKTVITRPVPRLYRCAKRSVIVKLQVGVYSEYYNLQEHTSNKQKN